MWRPFHKQVRLGGRLAIALLLLMTWTARRGYAQIAEESIPPANLLTSPSVTTATPGSNASAAADASTAATPGASATLSGDEPGSNASAAADASTAATPGASATLSGDEPAAMPSEPPPALDLSATKVGPDLSSISLDSEIKAATPARAAALRLTEKARRELLNADTKGALWDLGRAVSIDPSNPFEYYYLGRSYLARHDYAQAETFFSRAELGFVGRPDWLAETLSFEGATNEQFGSIPAAVKAYQRAVALAPDNVRAQVGLGRLEPSVGAVTGLDQPATANEDDLPPPAASAPPPAADESPAPPTTDISN